MDKFLKLTKPFALIACVLLCTLAAPLAGAAAEPSGAVAALLDRIEVLDLQTAAKIALADSPSLAAAQARVLAAAEVVNQARSAYMPRLDASAATSRVDSSERDLDRQTALYRALRIPVSADDPETYYQAGLSASWVVFDGFARKFNLASARYGEQASVEARNDAERLLLSAVTFAFLESQLAQENIAIAEADAAFNNRLLTEARLRYEVGAGTLSDMLNFQVRGNEAQTAIIQNERFYQNSLITLATLMGVPRARLPERLRLAELSLIEEAEKAAPPAEELVRTALDKRPDLRQFDWIVRQNEAGVESARAGYYPTVSLSAALDGQRPEDARFEDEDFGNSIALGMSWNLFAGGLTRARHAEAKARLLEVERTMQDARIRVASEVQSDITLIHSAQQQLVLQQANAQLVQQQRDLVEKEYKSGVGSLVRLNEAQRDLTVAQGRLVLARVALREAWFSLQASTGQIVELFRP